MSVTKPVVGFMKITPVPSTLPRALFGVSGSLLRISLVRDGAVT